MRIQVMMRPWMRPWMLDTRQVLCCQTGLLEAYLAWIPRMQCKPDCILCACKPNCMVCRGTSIICHLSFRRLYSGRHLSFVAPAVVGVGWTNLRVACANFHCLCHCLCVRVRFEEFLEWALHTHLFGPLHTHVLCLLICMSFWLLGGMTRCAYCWRLLVTTYNTTDWTRSKHGRCKH